jgi:hypothetical protein
MTDFSLNKMNVTEFYIQMDGQKVLFRSFSSEVWEKGIKMKWQRWRRRRIPIHQLADMPMRPERY